VLGVAGTAGYGFYVFVTPMVARRECVRCVLAFVLIREGRIRSAPDTCPGEEEVVVMNTSLVADGAHPAVVFTLSRIFFFQMISATITSPYHLCLIPSLCLREYLLSFQL
jgi:hypothetical protein